MDVTPTDYRTNLYQNIGQSLGDALRYKIALKQKERERQQRQVDSLALLKKKMEIQQNDPANIVSMLANMKTLDPSGRMASNYLSRLKGQGVDNAILGGQQQPSIPRVSMFDRGQDVSRLSQGENKINQVLGQGQSVQGATVDGYQLSPKTAETDLFGNPVVTDYDIVDTRSPEYQKKEAEESKAKLELSEKEKQIKTAKDMALNQAKSTLETIKNIRQGAKYFGVGTGVGDSGLGPYAGSWPSMPGTKRKNWEVNFEKLKSRLIVDLMAEMKNASKTGATGFGQLNKEELHVLKTAASALDRDLAPADAEEYLAEVERIALKVLKNAAQEEPAVSSSKKYSGGKSVQPKLATFSSEEEAVAANLPPGTEIIINGRRAITE